MVMGRNKVGAARRAAKSVRQLVPVGYSEEALSIVSIDPFAIERQEILSDQKDLMLRVLAMEVFTARTRNRPL